MPAETTNKTTSNMDPQSSAETSSTDLAKAPQKGVPVAPTQRASRKWMLGLCLAGIIPISCWLIFMRNYRPDFNPDLIAPNIAQDGNNPADDSANVAKLDLRGSVSDLLLKHPIEKAEHPLDPALMVAEAGLKHIRENVRDYTAVVSKRERVNGRLLGEEFFECKIRHAAKQEDQKIPLSMYLKFVKPKRIAGREVIWVEDQNNGRLVAHEAGVLGLVRVKLKPDSALAMRGQRYPITELGMETLIVRLIEHGTVAKNYDGCSVTFDRSLKINGHKCTLITLTLPEDAEDLDFYQAKIYIDDELSLPIGYAGFLKPETPGGPPILLEKYFYSDVKVNVGLNDRDFDPDNPEYDFP